MGDRTVVFRADPDAETSDRLTERLRASGIEILDQQPNMLLVSGAAKSVKDALGDAKGWNLSPESTIPQPETRVRAVKPPSE